MNPLTSFHVRVDLDPQAPEAQYEKLMAAFTPERVQAMLSLLIPCDVQGASVEVQ